MGTIVLQTSIAPLAFVCSYRGLRVPALSGCELALSSGAWHLLSTSLCSFQFLTCFPAHVSVCAFLSAYLFVCDSCILAYSVWMQCSWVFLNRDGCGDAG